MPNGTTIAVSDGVNVDVVIRYSCLAAIPIAGITVAALSPPAPVPIVSASEVSAEATAELAAAPTSPPKATANPGPAHARTVNAQTLPVDDSLPPAALGTTSKPARDLPKQHAGCESVQVRLITLSDDADWSMATIRAEPGKPALTRRKGDRVGDFKVKRIYWDRVELSGGSEACVVKIHDHDLGHATTPRRVASKRTAAKSKRHRAKPRPRIVTQGNVAPVNAQPVDAQPVSFADSNPAFGAESLDNPARARLPRRIAKHVVQTGDHEYSLGKRTARRIVRKAASLFDGVKLTKLSEADGYALEGILPTSLLALLGLEDGDVLLSGDGKPITIATLTAWFQAIADGTASVSIDVRRADATRTLVIRHKSAVRTAPRA